MLKFYTEERKCCVSSSEMVHGVSVSTFDTDESLPKQIYHLKEGLYMCKLNYKTEA